MTMNKGLAFLLKVLDGGNPAVYNTIAGLRTTQMAISGEVVAITSKDAGIWRELLSGSGVLSVLIEASGIFLGNAAECRLRAAALSGNLDDYELSFETGERMRGRFLIQRLDYSGDFNGERTFALQLESAGGVNL